MGEIEGRNKAVVGEGREDGGGGGRGRVKLHRSERRVHVQESLVLLFTEQILHIVSFFH